MILLDTIAYNTFLAMIRDEPTRMDPKLNKDKFMDFIMNYKGEKLIHSATIFELYMRDLKNPNINHFNRFFEDFNGLKKNGFRLMNESTWNFDWKKLFYASENNKSYDMSVYVKQKVEYEVTSISRYFMYMLLIVSDKLFDKYDDKVVIELLKDVIKFNFLLIEAKLKEYLYSYYLTNEKKEVSTKKFDYLLGYILSKMEGIIRNKLLLKKGFINRKKNLEEIYSGFSELESLEISGVQKTREILKGVSGKELNYLIINKVEQFESGVISEGRRSLTVNEKLYFIQVLLIRSIQQGYKVTKNDFSDCTIFSAFDCYNNKGKLITFDGTLRKLSKEFNVFYDEIIYNEIFK
ncbi:hypothetical protein AB1L07_18030 [Niallia alba]|uniref:hypothetical protein n=1 Tax=Niallia TaxID=2837506 RepID=UPI002903F11B|nr:hypothetical protein [Niallia nealsonii]MED5100742.1 hypothetical protein [Niallia circulans]